MSSGSKKKKPRFACLSEARASHSHRMWAEVSSSAPHMLHNGLPDRPIIYSPIYSMSFTTATLMKLTKHPINYVKEKKEPNICSTGE
jgi:hypothetical protein